MEYQHRKKKLLELVVEICNSYPHAADDDTILLEQVWLYQGWNEKRSLIENLRHVSRSESVTRRRREAHLKGLITYSSESNKQREEAFNNERMNSLLFNTEG